jgi:hypothetical protein
MSKRLLTADLTVNTEVPIYEPGDEFWDDANGKLYQYIYNGGASDIANGSLVYGTLLSADTVLSGTIVYSATCAKQAIGLGRGAITTLYYGWVQVWGTHTAAKRGCADSTSISAAGDYLVGQSTGIGVGVSISGLGGKNPFGVIPSAVTVWSLSTMTVFLTIKKP